MADIKDVQNYWENNPLLSHEFEDHGSAEFFKEFDRIKREDSDRYAIDYWEFDAFPDKKVLDVGCGPGWLTVHYALGGAQVSAVDLTSKAVELTKKHLEYKNTSASVQEGNAEDLPFDDNSFDMVVSSGVLHHTPDTQKAFKECYRVLKPGGTAKITLYRKGILHSAPVFAITKLVMKLAGVKHPGADLASESSSVDDFIRQYDGLGNPVGIGKKDKEWARQLSRIGFIVKGHEIHFFPKRFIPFSRFIPAFVHMALDRFLGTMVYFRLSKPIN